MMVTGDDSHDGSSSSITQLLDRIKDRDAEAAEQVWRRYFERLFPLVRKKLRGIPNRAVDEEDVLISVFDRFFVAVRQDRFARLEDRHDLWQILLMLTERKVADQFRHASALKRGGGQVAAEADLSNLQLAELEELADQEPSVEFVAAFNDCLGHAVGQLKDARIREIAVLRMEGYANSEIAQRLDISLSSVERKLRVIRELWQQDMVD